MGNLVNAIVICISMAIFGQTGPTLTVAGSKQVLMLTYGFGAFMALIMVLWRWTFLEESKVCVQGMLPHKHVTASARFCVLCVPASLLLLAFTPTSLPPGSFSLVDV